MFRKILLKVTLVTVVAVGVLTLSQERADAGWQHWGYSGYYGAYYAPYVTSYRYTGYYAPVTYRYPTYYYSSFAYPRHYWLEGYRTAYYGWPSYYRAGCCGTYGVAPVSYYYYRPLLRSCCRPRCYTACCTPTVTAYYYDPAVSCCGATVVGEPAEPAEAAPAPVPAPEAPAAPADPTPGPADAPPELPSVLPPAPADASSSQPTDATLAVRVPADAQVYINGRTTTTPGDYRQYVSKGLRSGYSYTYQVRAEVVQDGRRVSETKTVHMTAGDATDIAFDFASPLANNVATTLTLRVPEDAQVTLEGQATEATGRIRAFTTTQLNAGESWKDYDVVVSVERFGQTLTREQSITLVGGEPMELQVDFDASQVAAR